MSRNIFRGSATAALLLTVSTVLHADTRRAPAAPEGAQIVLRDGLAVRLTGILGYVAVGMPHGHAITLTALTHIQEPVVQPGGAVDQPYLRVSHLDILSRTYMFSQIIRRLGDSYPVVVLGRYFRNAIVVDGIYLRDKLLSYQLSMDPEDNRRAAGRRAEDACIPEQVWADSITVTESLFEYKVSVHDRMQKARSFLVDLLDFSATPLPR